MLKQKRNCEPEKQKKMNRKYSKLSLWIICQQYANVAVPLAML